MEMVESVNRSLEGKVCREKRFWLGTEGRGEGGLQSSMSDWGVSIASESNHSL